MASECIISMAMEVFIKCVSRAPVSRIAGDRGVLRLRKLMVGVPVKLFKDWVVVINNYLGNTKKF
jgi:hypothetical protein